MRNDAEAVIEGLFAAWRMQDIEATLAYCADDMVYEVHQPDGITGLGGVMIGRAQIRSYLEAVCARWEFLELAPVSLFVQDDCVRGQTQFRSLHRRTGLPLAGTKRHVWRVAGSRVARCDEYQDAVQLKAFLALADAQ